MQFGRVNYILVLFFLLTPFISYASLSPTLQRASVTSDITDYDIILDTRPVASCRASTIQGARCLPVEDVLAPNRRLANWSGILWLFGTAGLSGKEHVVIIGQKADRRDFMAGLLVLAGQKKVSVVETPVSDLSSDAMGTAGAMRSTTRTKVFTARMRSELILLASQVNQLSRSNAIILDGRTEAEFYGANIRAARGGHLPGATHSPLSLWRADPTHHAAIYGRSNVVAYSHDAFEGLVYFAALQAAGLQSRLYLAGWSEWALNGSFPADGVSYPTISALDKRRSNSVAAANKSTSNSVVIIGVMIGVSLLVISFFGGYKLAGRTA